MEINIVQAASNIADAVIQEGVYQQYMDGDIPEQGISGKDVETKIKSIIFADINADTLEYKPEYQEKFNKIYDYFFEMISNCKVTTKENDKD